MITSVSLPSLTNQLNTIVCLVILDQRIKKLIERSPSDRNLCDSHNGLLHQRQSVCSVALPSAQQHPQRRKAFSNNMNGLSETHRQAPMNIQQDRGSKRLDQYFIIFSGRLSAEDGT